MSQVSKKLRMSRRIQIYDSPFWLFFLNFIPVDRAEISHMNGQQNLSRLPSQPGYLAHMNRPLVDFCIALGTEEIIIDRKKSARAKATALLVRHAGIKLSKQHCGNSHGGILCTFMGARVYLRRK